MWGLGTPEIIIIAVVILILFGSRKMPEAARSLGRSLRILKTEVKGLHDDDDDRQPAAQPPAQSALPPGQTVTTPATPPSTDPTGTATAPSPGRTDAP